MKTHKKISFILISIFLFLGTKNIYSQDFWEPTNKPHGGDIYALAANSSGQIFVGAYNAVYRSTYLSSVPIDKPISLCPTVEEKRIFTQVLEDFQVNENMGDIPQENPAIAVDKNGNFVVVWEDNRNGNSDIYCQRFSSDGSPQGVNFKVNDDTSSANQDEPEIAMDDMGNFTVVWTDKSKGEWDPEVYGQRYSSDGSPQGSNFKINEDTSGGNHDNPAIAMDEAGNFVIVWADWGNRCIFCQRFSSDGSPQGANFKVNNNADASGIPEPAITIDGAGNFVVVWDDRGTDIYCQRYNSNGSPQGVNFKVNDEGNVWGVPAISADAVGNFVVVWEDLRNRPNEDIYCQRYSSNGSAQGTNFKVNDDVSNSYQWYPAVTIDEDGNFVVVWVDGRNGWNNPDIYAQIFNNNGQVVGTNYRVNNDVGQNRQHYPDVKLVNDHIYYTWEDGRIPDQNLNIFARIDMFNPVPVEERQSQQPIEYILHQNYPNPFNLSTTIQFSLPSTGFVTLKIYNILGEEVSTLVAESLVAGNYYVAWDASGLDSGVYYYRLQVDNHSTALRQSSGQGSINGSSQRGQQFVETKKLILLK